jgi:acyl-CoA thioester hydrolase
MRYKDYKHTVAIQIRFADIDRLNHVNNACYHNYAELARVKYFGEVLKPRINWDESGFILARTEIDHIETIFLEDEIYCFTKVSRIGNKSITINNAIVKKGPEGLIECAAITGILVAMDYTNNMSIAVPQIWRKLFEKFEGAL